VSFDPNADSIWPGAITQTSTLPKGSRRRSASRVDRNDHRERRRHRRRAVGGEVQPHDRRAEPRDDARGHLGMFAQSPVRLAAKSNYLAETAYSANERA